jgi:acyl-CoA reductase-like NAD-dependent aldehyde dehydrogenase
MSTAGILIDTLTGFELKIPELRTWISGEPEQSRGSKSLINFDPNNLNQLPESRESSLDQLENALAQSWKNYEQSAWQSLPIEDKIEVFEKFAVGLEQRTEDIASLDALNSGVPISVTRLICSGNSSIVRDAITRAKEINETVVLPSSHSEVRLLRIPWGPTALITPWNAPSPMVIKKMAFALAAGAPVVVKPSPIAPHSAELIAEAAAEAGFPAGTWSLIRGGGEIGDSLVCDDRVRAISMTGSTGVGRGIALRTIGRFTRLQLELGSNNPAIVRADADIKNTATALISGAWKLSGQWCEAPRLVFAHRDVYEDLLFALKEESSKWRVGSSLDDLTQIGPVATRQRQKSLFDQRNQLVSLGAQVFHEHEAPLEGSFFPATIMRANGARPDGEIFGPLLLVEQVGSDREALVAASTGNVGLAAYVFSEDIEVANRLAEHLPAGEIKINGTSVLDLAPNSEQSFFGNSGLGGHGDNRLLEFFTGTRVIGEDRPHLPL